MNVAVTIVPRRWGGRMSISILFDIVFSFRFVA